jgi:hypothetical protein
MKSTTISTVVCIIATVAIFTAQMITSEKALALPIRGGIDGGGGWTPLPTPTTTPTKIIDGGTYVHWYQITNMNNLISLAKGAMLTGGYLLAHVPIATAVVAGISSGAWPAAAAAAVKLVPGTTAYIAAMSKLHGFGARGDDLLYPTSKITTNTGASCKVVDVYVKLLDRNYNEIKRTSTTNPASALIIWPASTIGVYVAKEHPGTDRAAADIHWWYDMGTAVRYQLLYTVTGGQDCAIR